MIARNIRRRIRSLAQLTALLAASAAPTRAQEPVWSIRFGGGVIAATGGGDSTPANATAATAPVDLGNGGMLTVDVIKAVDGYVEIYASGVMPLAVSVRRGTTSFESIAPSSVQIGLNYLWWRRGPNRLYVTPFVAGFGRERAISRAGEPAESITFPGAWGIGAGAGYRRKLNDRWSLDASVKWQGVRWLAGDQGRVSWNPALVSAGVVRTLW